MSISEKIRDKALEVFQESTAKKLNPALPTPISDEVRDKAVAAVLSGNGKPEWETYMKIFTSDMTELDRLIPRDATTDVVRQQARAYLVSNGVCGIGTTAGLLNEVTTKLDI
jgi:hypothetical protein